MKPYDPAILLKNTEFVITVLSVFRNTEWRFVVCSEDIVKRLIARLAYLIEASVVEITLHPLLSESEPSPYGLRDDMPLGKLLEEHRTLIMLVTEKPTEVAPSRLLVRMDGPNKRPTLDLTRAHEEDIPYIHYWIVQEYACQARAVAIPWDHPQAHVMIHEIHKAFDAAFVSDCRIEFPHHFYLVSHDGSDSPPITVEQRNALAAFYRVLGDNYNARAFRTVTVYAGKGIFGNSSEEPMELTPKHMETVDLILSDEIDKRNRAARPQMSHF